MAKKVFHRGRETESGGEKLSHGGVNIKETISKKLRESKSKEESQ